MYEIHNNHLCCNLEGDPVVIQKERLLPMKLIILTMLLSTCYMASYEQARRGKQAPEISLPDLQGNLVQLSSLRGKVVLIDFWASWCVPCRKNNPSLVKLYEQYHSMGLEILGVSIDENAQNWKTAVEKDQLRWIQVNDNKGWNSSSTLTYEVDAIPASILIDKEGVVRQKDLEGRKLEATIKSLL